MKFLEYLKALRQPPWVVLPKATSLVRRELAMRQKRRLDRKRSTYGSAAISRTGELHRYLSRLPEGSLRSRPPILKELTDLFLDHRFDLLGSGWVRVAHGVSCRGVEGIRYEMGKRVLPDLEGHWLEGRINPANLAEAKRIWRLVDDGYDPIDWQLDFKSGYRWAETDWYQDIRFGRVPGGDIKVPWELARMQHLPQLARACASAVGAGAGLRSPEVYSREFRNQVLDFIATNPPRFGVNWASTMDVGIRVANWLIAYDLFRAFGACFDEEFLAVFRRSVHEHGEHICDNLEWDPSLRGNHYLADIVGLLFVSSYLPSSAATNVWLALAVQEFVAAVGEQFHRDGTNFEASTCYHRLSAEMVLYATALVLGFPPEKGDALQDYDARMHRRPPALAPPPLPLYPLMGTQRRTPFPDWFFDRLKDMGRFTLLMTKPNGRVAQIGDNDSGRFLRIRPDHRRTTVAEAKRRYWNLEGYNDLPEDAVYLDDDPLDHRHLVAAMSGLFCNSAFAMFSESDEFESDLVKTLSGGILMSPGLRPANACGPENVRIGTVEGRDRIVARLNALPPSSQGHVTIPCPRDVLREPLLLSAYVDFGLFLFRSDRLFLAVRCGSIGQNGAGGHAHNDQLSIELNVDGEDWIADPGTYLYTPLPLRRNEYRSVHSHFAPRVGGKEPGDLELGLFRLGNEARAECLYFGEQGFLGTHRGYGDPVFRCIRIREEAILVSDYSEGSPLAATGGGTLAGTVPYSDGYGKRRAK